MIHFNELYRPITEISSEQEIKLGFLRKKIRLDWTDVFSGFTKPCFQLI